MLIKKTPMQFQGQYLNWATAEESFYLLEILNAIVLKQSLYKPL